jgi:hypothetical protein
MYFNGSLKLGGGSTRVLFISPTEEELKYIFYILFKVSNNEAEYEALLQGLWPGSLSWHQATTHLWRLLAGDPTSQQGVRYQQGHNGRICHRDT